MKKMLMGSHEHSSISQSQKQLNDLEIFDYEMCKCNANELDANKDQDDSSNTNTSLEKKDFLEWTKNDWNVQEDDEDATGNLFRLSVLFVRGNPFDSLKHWRMRCSFLDANLQIGSLGRIREVDEEFLNIAEKEKQSSTCISPKRGVRLIQVRPKEDEVLPETAEPKQIESFEELNKFCAEQYCKYDDDVNGLANNPTGVTHSKRGKNLPTTNVCQNATQNGAKASTPINQSITSLADAIRLPDEQKTSSITKCEVEKIPEDSSDSAQEPETTTKTRPGFFNKIFRRITGLFQGNKVDFRPVRGKSQTVCNSAV